MTPKVSLRGGRSPTKQSKRDSREKILLGKQKLRKEILEKLKIQNQDKEQILKKSLKIKEKLFELEEFRKARCVVFYVSMPTEVNTHQMIDESVRIGKCVGVPVVVKGKKDLIISQIRDGIRDFKKGPLGIMQPKKEFVRPISPLDMDLVLVPGVAFDKNGNRLGRGKGFYDRFLKRLPKNARTIGLCFDFQIVESIPTLPHDISIQMLLTN